MQIDIIWLKMVSINLNIIILSCVLSLSRTMTNVVNDSMSNLLVISFDGFRPDFFNRNLTPAMNRVRKRGASAEYMRPVFPTKTLINHFSIATGLYSGVHGITAKSLYDRKLEKELAYGLQMYHYNEAIRPIWTLNEKSGKHSGCMMWSGTNFSFQNTTCTFTVQYNMSVPWTERVDKVFSWFNHPSTPVNLAMLYFEHPDKLEHIYSPDSDEVNNIIAQLDNLMEYIQLKLDEEKLREKLNIIYLSDHGMTSLSLPFIINLTNFLELQSYKIYGSSPIFQVIPVDGKEDEVYRNLSIASTSNGHFRVYNSTNLPDRWHYQNDQRTGPITVVADIGYAFQDRYEVAKKYEAIYNLTMSDDRKYGIHGYDNLEPLMRAIFFAEGPKIQSDYVIAPFNNVDLYNLFCLILDIIPDPNNGTRENIYDLMVVSVKPESSSYTLIVIIACAILSILLISASIILAVYWFKRRKTYMFYRNSSTLSIIPLQ